MPEIIMKIIEWCGSMGLTVRVDLFKVHTEYYIEVKIRKNDASFTHCYFIGAECSKESFEKFNWFEVITLDLNKHITILKKVQE